MVFSSTRSNVTGPVSGTGANISSAEDVLGVQIINVGSTALTGNIQTPTLTNIDSYHGLPLTALHFNIQVLDTTGTTTAPVTIQSIENVIKKFRLQSINGQYSDPLVDFDGTYFNISRWQRLKNPYGYYNTPTNSTETTTATLTTINWNFDLYYTIPSNLFPLRPTVSLNTQASRAATTNLMASSAAVTVTADYTAAGIGATRTRLKSLAFAETATGTPALGPNLDKNVSIVQQAYDFGIDTNLTSTNTFNLSIQGQQIFNNKPYADISNAEAAKFPGTSHISGFFPFSVADTKRRYLDYSTNFSAAISSAPYVNSSSGPNSYTSTMAAYLEEIF